MKYLTEAIRKLRPTAEFSFQENDYSTIKWDVLEGEAPTLEEVQVAHLQVEEDIKAAELEAIAKREAALAKLAALGLDTDDLKALGL
jgi:hypothetical protein